MTKNYTVLSILLLLSIVLSGCATKPKVIPIETNEKRTLAQRATLLLSKKEWKLKE